jgi:hypothetical protein
MFLVVSVVSGRDTATWLVGGLAVLFGLTWYVQPLLLRKRRRNEDA